MLFYFIMVNSAKKELIKKNHLTCDHTMREVLTTSNYYNNIPSNTERPIQHSNIGRGSISGRHICSRAYMKCMYTSAPGHIVDCIEFI